MPFTTSKYSAEFLQTLMANVQTVLERDANTALAAIDNTLATFADYTTPNAIATVFPCLYLEPSRSELEQSQDDSYITEQHEMVVTVSIVAPVASASALTPRITKYTRAIDQVLRSASVADLVTSLSAAKRKPAWEVTRHTYGPLRGNDAGSTFRRDSQILFVVQTLER